MTEPTHRQRLVLTFIANYLHSHGYPPSIREIGEHFGWKSNRSVEVHLIPLGNKGLIIREVGVARAIKITGFGFCELAFDGATKTYGPRDMVRSCG